ncbi:pentapeptide repeat-containing protein [Nostoc sp.]|uniref:pentapeptide repeat-containing protein n=1 Tax=Nostoc sp. TaxID=1180 RepID=UPI002FFD4CFE
MAWALSLFLVVVGFILLEKFNLLTLPFNFLGNTPFMAFFGLALCSITFIVSRSAIALFDILFSKPQWLKIISFFTLMLAANVGVNTATKNVMLQEPSIQAALANLTNGEQAIIKAIAGAFGFIYAIGFALSGLLVNRRRNVPWNHPDLLRDWALAISSWGGTSFHNLDLSEVNFKNAQLANTDLRARKLYRTCFQGVTGLERARVDSRYLDLEIPKVQKLLTHGCSEDPDLSNLNLRGAYLQGADLRRMKFIDTDLTGADLQGADLRGSILANAQTIAVDFTNPNLTGICIQNWNVNSQTCFTNVECDYIYRKLDEKGEPIDRHPLDRNFEPREFESLYQEVGNVVELVFKEGVNWRAFAFSLQKLELENESLGLELKGIEKQGDLWVAKVTHNQNISHAEVEKRLNDSYEELKQQLSTREQQINSLLGIASTQAETIKEFSKRPFGNSFVINGSTITNLTGSGQIEYNEAADQVRSLVANATEPVQVSNIVQHLLAQLQGQSVATTAGTQAELIKQLLLNEAEKDSVFKQLLVLQSQQIIDSLPEGSIVTAIKQAIAQLQRSSTNS